MERILRAKPYIIAEVGSNWRCLEDCLNSVIEAKKAGANAVKFQHFSAWDLYGPVPDVTSSSALRDLRDNTIDRWLVPISGLCQEHRIDFLCSAFSIEGYRRIDPFVRYHKIASSEFNHVPLVREVVKMGKPILASLGGHVWPTISAMLDEYPVDKTCFMECRGSYPSFDLDFDLDTDEEVIGLSDHSLGIFLPVALHRRSALEVLEKHFRLDHIKDTPDAPHSINQHEFKQMVDLIRAPVPDDEEAHFKQTALRKAKALRDIEPGEALVYGENFAYFRTREPAASNFLSPTQHDRLTGENAVKTAIKAGEVIRADVVDFPFLPHR